MMERGTGWTSDKDGDPYDVLREVGLQSTGQARLEMRIQGVVVTLD